MRFLDHPAPVVVQPRQIPDKALSLVVSNEYFTARAEWRRRANVWACVKADRVIRWMLPLNKDKAMIELLKRGCRWEWQ